MAIDDLQKYLITRGKDAITSGDPFMAKSWLLTCGVLFPASFTLQYERYLLSKRERDVTAANKYLCQMLNNPEASDYPELKEEKKLMVTVIKEDNDRHDNTDNVTSGRRLSVDDLHSEEKSFLRTLFHSLSPQLQYKCLMSVAKESDASWFDLCQLRLLTLKMFPTRIDEEGSQLIQLVLKAEASDSSTSSIVYQKMLMFDVLPLTLSSKASTSNDQQPDVLLAHIGKLLGFFVEHSFISKNNPVEEVDDLESKTNDVIVMIARKLNWSVDLFDSKDIDSEVILNRILSAFHSLTSSTRIKSEPVINPENADAPIDLSSCKRSKRLRSTSLPAPPVFDPIVMKQLMFSVLIFFVKCLNQYQRESLKSKTALVEFPSTVSSSVPSSSSSVTPAEIVSDPKDTVIKNYFISCIKCLDLMLDPVFSLTHEFFQAIKVIGVETSIGFLNFSKDACLFRGKYDDFIRQSVAVDTEKSLKPVVQTISASLMLYDYKACLNYCVIAAEMLHSMKKEPKKDTIQKESTAEESSTLTRKLQFIHLEYSSVTDFVIDCMISCMRGLIAMSLKPSDSDIGNLIVLTQYLWPKYLPIFKTCLNQLSKPLSEMPTGRSSQLPSIHRFVYLAFTDYVFQPDVLEEFMFLASDERMSMELKPPTATVGSKSMTTRGVNKGVKEEVKTCLVNQMKKSSQINLTSEHFINFILSLKHSFRQY